VAGAVAAGADFVYMGTRFLASEESMAQPEYKQMVVDAGPDDLVVSASVTGTPASWLRPSLVAAGQDPDNLGAAPDRNYTSGGSTKRWRDIWAAGQGLEAVRAVEPVSKIVDQLSDEYDAAIARFQNLAGGRVTRGAAA
jgi:nitronate monooxygenase